MLGFVHLIEIGLEFAHCSHREFIFLPILHFCFVFLIMHFAFSQSRNGSKLGFSNIALSHLLVTQITLWLVHFDRNYGSCGYSYQPTALTLTSAAAAATAGAHNESSGVAFDAPIVKTDRSSLHQPLARMVPAPTAASAAITTSYPFNGILVPVIHHYQLLTITILASIWLANNHADSFDSPFNLRNAFSNTDSELGYQFFKKKASIKGFFVGLLMTSGTIVVLVLKDQQLSLIAHTVLQVGMCFAATLPSSSCFTLLLRAKQIAASLSLHLQPFCSTLVR